MSVKEEQAQVVAYLRGELGPVETVRFERALAESAQLRAELAAARRTLGFVEAAAEDVAPPAKLREVVFERVAEERQLPRVRPSLKELARDVGPRRRTRAVLFALAAAASVVLAVVLSWQFPDDETSERLPLATLRWSYGEVYVSNLVPGDVPSPPVQIARESETSEAPWLFAGQRIRTHENSYAECELGTRARILLDERTTLTVLEAQTPDEADWLWLEQGVAHFDVSNSTYADDDGLSPAGVPRPFIVFTRHGEVRVRGTRFLMRSTDDVTIVAVLQGRVDAFTVPRHGEARPMEPVTGGRFAALGSRDALRRALPSNVDLSELDHVPQHGAVDESEAGAMGAPVADPAHPVIFTSPMLAVAFEVNEPRVDVDDEAPVWGRITLRNQSPFGLDLLHTGEDNLMLHHRGTAPETSPWSPVRALRRSLDPGEEFADRVTLPTVFYEHGIGPYYVSAVYTGVAEVNTSLMHGLVQAGATLPQTEGGVPYSRTAVFESRSNPVSVVYRRNGGSPEVEDEDDD